MVKSKIARMSKSGIEYMDYMWGIFSGCLNYECGKCPLKRCWARGMTRFTNIYPHGFKPTFYPLALGSPMWVKEPSRIAVGWVGDIIGYGLEHKNVIYDTIHRCLQHTFIFLTKNPENLIKWTPFPDNCWVGVSATDRSSFHLASSQHLREVDASVKFISIEPMLGRINTDIAWYEGKYLEAIFSEGWLNWLIIGQQTPVSYNTQPKIDWISEIVEAADKAGIPVFLKDNLSTLFAQNDCEGFQQNKHLFKVIDNFPTRYHLRQEFPKEKN